MEKKDLRIVYMGTPEFAVESLRALVFGPGGFIGYCRARDGVAFSHSARGHSGKDFSVRDSASGRRGSAVPCEYAGRARTYCRGSVAGGGEDSGSAYGCAELAGIDSFDHYSCLSGSFRREYYFAVRSDLRGGGIGTQALHTLARYYADRLDDLILECEHPDEAPDHAIAERRIAFYLRAGACSTKLESRVFGVRYRILALPCGDHAGDEVVGQELKDLYRMMVPEPYYRGNVIFFNA